MLLSQVIRDRFYYTSLYYPQIIHIPTVKIIAAIIHCSVSFHVVLHWACHHCVCGWNNKKCKSTMCSELNGERTVTDVVCSRGRSYEVTFCALRLVPSRQCLSVQPAIGIEQKKRQCKLRCGVNWQRALKQKGVKQIGVSAFFPGVRTARA